MKGFRDFLNQGNVVQLAVAFVIGGAFGAVVTALVADIINPIIAIPFGKPNFDKLVVTINGSEVQYGTFITAVIAFLFIAAGVYFFFVLPYNRLQARARSAAPAEFEHARVSRMPDGHPQGSSPLLGVHGGGRAPSRVTKPDVPDAHAAHLDELSPRILLGILAVRQDVFVVEQNCVYPDIDAHDAEAETLHLWIEDGDGRVLSTLRLLLDSDGAHRVGRVATLAGARGYGNSGALLRRAIELAGSPIVLSAQAYLVDWYARFGFEVCGERWIEDGIEHAPMRLDVKP